MHKATLLLALIFTSWQALAQKVSGLVQDYSGNPLPGVAVSAGEAGTVTQPDGRFVLEIPLPDTLHFHLLGFEDQVVFVASSVDLGIIRLQAAQEELGEVVVTAGRFDQRREELTVSLEVIRPYLSEEKNSLTIEDALQQTPGLNITDGQANIRSGSGWSYGAGTRVLVLVDEIPLISPDANQVRWELVPLEIASQTEVLKGASSALFGSAALNGVINIRTVTPAKPETRVSLFVSAYDAPSRPELKWWTEPRAGVGMQAYHGRPAGNWNLVLSAQAFNNTRFKYKEEETRARLFWKAERKDPSVRGLSYGLRGSILSGSSGDALIWQGYDRAYVALDSSVTRSTGLDFYLDPYAVWQRGRGVHKLHGRFLGIDTRAKDETSVFDNASQMGYAEYQYQHFFEEVTLTGGVSASISSSQSEIFQGDHSASGQAIFLQGDWSRGRWTLSGGARWEAYVLDDRTFQQPVFRGGLNYRATQSTYLRASYGEGFRFPSMAEAFTFTNVGAIYIYPNPNLRPERGWNSEIGVTQLVRLGGFLFTADLAAFWMEYRDMMEFAFSQWESVPGNPLGLGFKSINVGATRIRGVEFTLTGKGKIGEVDLQLLAGLSYMDPQPVDPHAVYAENGAGNPITYVNSSSDPGGVLKYRYRVLAKWDAQLGWRQWKGGFSLRYNDFMQNIDYIFESPLMEIILPGIGIARSRRELSNGDFLADLRLGYAWNKHWETGLAVNNLLNREYAIRPADLGSPREFVLRVTYRSN